MKKETKGLSEKYKSTFGTWQVTTEGDCEGKTIRNLGTFTGHIDEIALHLAPKAFYKLTFKRLEDIDKVVYEDTEKEVKVALSIESNTWNMNRKEIKEIMKDIFSERPVEIEESNEFASFKIKRK